MDVHDSAHMSTNLPIENDLHDGNMFIKNESSVTFVTLDDRNHGDENVGVVEVWAIVALGLPEINKDLAVELTTTLQRRFCCWYFIQRDDGKFNLVPSEAGCLNV